MKRYGDISRLLAITLALGVLPGALRAAEPEAAAEAPARQIKFVLEDEPLELEVHAEPQDARPQEKLPEGTFYAAVVRGYAPLLVDTNRQGQSTTAGFQAVGMVTVNHSTPAAKRLGELMRKYNGVEWQLRFQSRVVEEASTANEAPRLRHSVFHDKFFDFLE